MVARYSYTPNSPFLQYWNVPLRNPDARHAIVQDVLALTGTAAINQDGRRMLISSASLASLHVFIHEVSREDGSLFGAVGPPGGIQQLQEFEYLGPDGDVLVSASDPDRYERLGILRHDQRQVLVPLATDLDYFGVIYRSADADGTGIAFSLSLVGGTGRFHAYVTDVNLPGVSLPLGRAPASDEDVYVFAALGAPLP